MYWGACFSVNSSLCLRCSDRGPLAGTAVSKLHETDLPGCPAHSPGYNSMTAAVSTLSQYIAVTVLVSVLFVILIIGVSLFPGLPGACD